MENQMKIVLKELRSNNNMDYNEDFLHMTHILNYCNEYVEKFEKIHFIGGMETHLNVLIMRLYNLFYQKGYVARDFQPIIKYDLELRKITFFLFLHTDISFKYNLVDDIRITHLMSMNTPKLTKCLFLYCIKELHLWQYFFECIANSPLWFAYHYLDKVVDIFKHVDPFTLLECVNNIIKSIYKNIIQSKCIQLTKSELKIILTKYSDHAMEYLRHFYTPDAGKLANFTKPLMHKYLGYVIKNILEISVYCFNLFINKLSPSSSSSSKSSSAEAVDEEKYKIYKLMKDKEILDEHNINWDCYNAMIKESLLNLNIILLNSLENNLMLVDMDMFCFWVEIELSYTDDCLTLQRAIGEQTYYLNELLKSNGSTIVTVEHSVMNMLNNFIIKPISMEEKLTAATIGQILLKLEMLSKDDPMFLLYLNELFSRHSLAFGNDECLQMILDNCQYLNIFNIKSIISYISSLCKIDEIEDLSDTIKIIILNSFENFTEQHCKELILFIFTIFNDEYNNNIYPLQTDNFDNELIEIFNRSFENNDKKCYLKLLTQNPNSFYDKLFFEAIRNEQQLNDMIKIIQLLSNLFNGNHLKIHLPKILEKSKTMSVKEQQLLSTYLYQLFLLNIIEQSEFIENNLYHLITTALTKSQYTEILILLKTFTLLAHKIKFNDNLMAPLLVMAGQIQNQCRWDMLKYTEELERIITLCNDFLTTLMKKFLPIATKNDKLWIISQIKTFKPIPLYYFHKLTLRKNMPTKTFDEFLHPKDFETVTPKDRISFLCETIVRCTRKEIEWLSKNKFLLPHFIEAIELIGTIANRTAYKTSIDCFRHCFQCFLYIVKDYTLPSNHVSSINEKTQFLVKTLKLLSKLTNPLIYDELLLNTHFIFIDIIKLLKSDMTPMEINEIQLEIDNLNACEAKTLFDCKFKEIFK